MYVRDDLGISTEKIYQIGKGLNQHEGKYRMKIEYAPTERDLFKKVAEAIYNCDPDVIVSYEAEKTGIGYLIKRSKYIGSDFIIKTSRQTSFIVQQTYMYKKLSSLLPGRVILSC